jgi:hypothetical protein
MKRFAFIVFSLIFGANTLSAQNDTIKFVLSLEEVIDMAVTQSSAIKYVQNTNVNYYWRYRNYKTQFRPQLVFNSDLPNYRHTTQPVTQPDGSIEFKQVSNLSASANLSLNQSIPLLGTYIYAGTSAYGIRNLNLNTTSFSGAPFVIGFTQPLFGYNWMKWYKKTEPMVYDEAQKRFVEDIEQISLNATYRYFNFLSVQTNFNLAENNLKNSLDNLKISQTKQNLGQISENDYSRIELSVLNAEKSLNQARMELKNADFELRTYIGLKEDRPLELIIPLEMTLFDISPEVALAKAKENRKETSLYQRRLINADRELAEAKSNTGVKATLTGSFGLSNSGETLPAVYENPQKDRTLRVALNLPILDWGRSASSVKLAETARDLTIFDVNKDIDQFNREIIVQVEQFSLLKDQLKTANEADKVAGNGYVIALRKFQNGELSITDLNIALQERDKAKRDYIYSIRAYWVAYYQLRIFTLFDFEKNSNITYGNPML